MDIFDTIEQNKENVKDTPTVEGIKKAVENNIRKSFTKKLEVRPLPEGYKWHGKTGEDSITRPKGFHPLVDKETMTYSVDLSDKEIEEFSNIMKTDMSLQHTPGIPHPYWDGNRARVKLENNTMFFESNSMPGRIKCAILRGSKYVANSLEEWEEGLWDEATHYIVDEEAAGKIKAAKYDILEEVIIQASKLSVERKTQLIMILAEKDVSKLSDNMIKGTFSELIQQDAEKVLLYMQKKPIDIATEAMVEKGITIAKLSRHKNGSIFFGDERLGFNVAEAVEFLVDDENQELRLRIRDLVS